MLARAQAELASFRSRQQLASSARQAQRGAEATQLQLDTRMAELEADRQTFGALQQQLKSQRRGLPRRRRSARWPPSPAMADNPTDQRALPAAAPVPGPARLDDHRPVAGVADQSRSDPAPGLDQSTTQNSSSEAVSSQLRTIDARIGALAALRAPERRVHPDPPRHGRGGDAARTAGSTRWPNWATTSARTTRRPAWRRRSRRATSTSSTWRRSARTRRCSAARR